MMASKRHAKEEFRQRLTFGDRIADRVTEFGGSWRAARDHLEAEMDRMENELKQIRAALETLANRQAPPPPS